MVDVAKHSPRPDNSGIVFVEVSGQCVEEISRIRISDGSRRNHGVKLGRNQLPSVLLGGNNDLFGLATKVSEMHNRGFIGTTLKYRCSSLRMITRFSDSSVGIFWLLWSLSKYS